MKHKTFTEQRNTEADPSGAANAMTPYMNLTDVQHSGKAAQDVGAKLL